MKYSLHGTYSIVCPHQDAPDRGTLSTFLQNKANEPVNFDKLSSITKCDVRKMKQKRKVCACTCVVVVVVVVDDYVLYYMYVYV